MAFSYWIKLPTELNKLKLPSSSCLQSVLFILWLLWHSDLCCTWLNNKVRKRSKISGAGDVIFCLNIWKIIWFQYKNVLLPVSELFFTSYFRLVINQHVTSLTASLAILLWLLGLLLYWSLPEKKTTHGLPVLQPSWNSKWCSTRFSTYSYRCTWGYALNANGTARLALPFKITGTATALKVYSCKLDSMIECIPKFDNNNLIVKA